MQRIRLKPGKEKILETGHPWIFSGGLKEQVPDAVPGEIVTVCSHTGTPLAAAFYHPRSDISLRILSRHPEEACDSNFWKKRILEALDLRKNWIGNDTDAFRVIHAEGDGFPGLIADLYGRSLVISISTAGIELLKDEITGLLTEIIRPVTFIERSSGKARRREGLEDRDRVILGPPEPERVTIQENGYRFCVDIARGQKTGFFLDQRDNRDLVGRLSKNLSVLNCFAYSGGFSVYSACRGAARVVSVEVSAEATGFLERNFKLNSISSESHPVMTADVFQFLREWDEQFDLIVLDPPAFAKSRHDIAQASKGYKEIHVQAMKRIKPGGLLATFSCSNFVDELLFARIVLGAAKDAKKEVQMLKPLGPGPDHPTLLAHPEGRYLKGLLLRCMNR